jgi:hypothetical protein
MTGKAVRQYYYQIRSIKDGSSTIRTLAAPTMLEVAEKAFRLYKALWGEFPDVIEATRKNMYTFIEIE